MNTELIAIEMYDSDIREENLINFNKNYKIEKIDDYEYSIRKINDIDVDIYGNVKYKCLIGKNGSGKTKLISDITNFKRIFIKKNNLLYVIDGHRGNYMPLNKVDDLTPSQIPTEINEDIEFTISIGEDQLIYSTKIHGLECLFKDVSLFEDNNIGAINFYKNYINDIESKYYSNNVTLKLHTNSNTYLNNENNLIDNIYMNYMNKIKSKLLDLIANHNSFLDELSRKGDIEQNQYIYNEKLHDINNTLSVIQNIRIGDDEFEELSWIKKVIKNFNILIKYKNENFSENNVNLSLVELFCQEISGTDLEELISIKIENLPTGYKNLQKIENLIRNTNENMDLELLFFDELDFAFHPEMQRTLKKEISDMISYHNKNKANIHIIYTTHSPFMTQGFFENELYKLECNQLTNNKIKIYPMKSTYGANILDILFDDFYLESSYGYEIEQLIETSNINNDISDKIKLIKNKFLKGILNDKFGIK